MIPVDEITQIGEEIKNYTPPLEVKFFPSDDRSEISTALFNLAETLTVAAGAGIKLLKENEEHLDVVPALVFRHPGSGKIRYHTLPDGPEAAPFKEMITYGLRIQNDLPEDLQSQLSSLKQPVAIKVFMTSTCPNCPHAVSSANTIAFYSKHITTSIINVEEFPELAEPFNIRSVPMTIIDDGLLINQVVPATKLAQVILARGTDDYENKLFLSLVENGNIERAAQRVLHTKLGSQHFLTAWENSSLSTRMGLMLVASQALKQNAAILHDIVNKLIDLLDTQDISLLGDTADLLGQIGHEKAREPLHKLIVHSNPDIADIAKEAMQNIDQRKE